MRRRRHTAPSAELHRRGKYHGRKKKTSPCGSRELVVIHGFGRAFNAKKRTPVGRPFFGAEDEIRTRATVSHTTPLAGEPLEPLGYFCMAHLFKSYTTISHFSLLVKAFSLKKEKTFRNFFKKSRKKTKRKFFPHLSKRLTDFLLCLIIKL